MPDTAIANQFDEVPTFDDILHAADRLRGWATETPLLEYAALNELVGGRVLLKAESLQRTGSFKFRGAFNRIVQLPEAQRKNGVVAFSSGNHAQGVAAAAAILNLPAVIVMPRDAPKIKVRNTKAYGAEVILYDRLSDSREEIGDRICRERGATLVRPYDDGGIIAGQGTCGLEIAHQAEALGARPDTLLVCCGGGGLTAGCAIALERTLPGATVMTVEPIDYDDTRRSLEAGQILRNDASSASICDALLAPQPGSLTFAANKSLVSGGLAVADQEVKAAMAYAFRVLKLVLEPGGAVCLAAVLAGKIDCAGRTVALTLSGGNVDPDLYRTVLQDQA
ncbi:threonine ammonia-lyase [Pelagibius sp.]|uniref:threonine ammonia-lyase n=1 Tax=Pelagibius sp. TaxID=1931238 RepID=UPI003B512CF3